MRNILDRVRKRDRDRSSETPKPFTGRRAVSRRNRPFSSSSPLAECVWHSVKQLEKDLPELLNFFDCPKPLWKKVRTTNLIERCLSKCDAAHGRWWSLTW